MRATALRYDVPGVDLVLEFSLEVLGHFTTHKQIRHRSKEAGGQLFANMDDPGTWRVIDVTGPRPLDIRALFGYRPNRKQERKEISERYACDLHFIGDWHSHPEELPHPSLTDNESMRETVQNSLHDLPGFVMVIVGRAHFPPGLHVSFHQRDGAVYVLKAREESGSV